MISETQTWTCVRTAHGKLGIVMPAWKPSTRETKEGGQEVKIILSYTAKSRPTWVI